MADPKMDTVASDNQLSEDAAGRRSLALALFGALGGVGLMEACAGEPPADGVSPSESPGQVAELLTGTTSLFWCDTYVDLRGQQGGNLQTSVNVAVVRGATSGPPYAGGGGVFIWEHGVTTGENGGTIIVPTTSPGGRWTRLYSGPLNVRWFGAKGDGTGNNQPAFAAALGAIPNGGTVYVPAGTYRITSPIVVSAPPMMVDGGGSIPTVRENVNIVGDGPESIITAAYSSLDNSVITLQGCSHCRLQRLWLTAPEVSPANIKVWCGVLILADQESTRHNQLIDLRIGSGGTATPNFQDGIQIQSQVDKNNEQHLIQNVDITGCNDNGICFFSCSNSNWNKIVGGHIGYCNYGIRCYGGNFTLFGTSFGSIQTALLHLQYDDDTGTPSVSAQRYPLLLVGARAEVGNTALFDTAFHPGTCYVHFIDLSWYGGGTSPLISFSSPGALTFESCRLFACEEKAITVSGTGTLLSITNSWLGVANITMSGNNSAAYLAGNTWNSGPNYTGNRVNLVGTGATATAIGERGLFPPPLSLGPVPAATPTTPGLIYKDGGFLKVS